MLTVAWSLDLPVPGKSKNDEVHRGSRRDVLSIWMCTINLFLFTIFILGSSCSLTTFITTSYILCKSQYL